MAAARETDCCLQVWLQAEPIDRAREMDERFPACGCECHSFCPATGGPIKDGEMLARLFTSPALYDIEADEIVRSRITSVHSRGLSIIRQSASDEEIVLTVRELTESAAERQTLIGASFFRAVRIRSLADPDRWFCVYHTPAPHKTHHADLLGTMPNARSKSQRRNQLSDRRNALAELLFNHLVRIESVGELIHHFRQMPLQPSS